jgi:hypothetical protein
MQPVGRGARSRQAEFALLMGVMTLVHLQVVH